MDKKCTGHQKRQDLKRKSSQHVIAKTPSIQKKKKTYKRKKKKTQVTDKGKVFRITADFLMETLKSRRAWSNAL